MVHKDIIERRKAKPRGRPFVKGGKHATDSKDEVLATSGRKIGIEGGVVASALESAIVEPLNEGIELQLPPAAINTINKIIKESMESPAIEEIKSLDEDTKALELIESIEFKNGENILAIRFSKKHNRMFRIQIFLNNETEIRPVTYTGASTGYTFWNLLKGALKK